MIVEQVRKIGTNRRSLTGTVSLRGIGLVPFESSLERDLLILLDFDPLVKNVVAQPVKIPFSNSQSKSSTYTPDYYVEYESASSVIFEVKFQEELQKEKQKLKLKFDAARNFCCKKQWEFEVFSEVEIRGTPVLKNAKFLRQYNDLREEPGVETQLVRTLVALGRSTPGALMEASFLTEQSKMLALPYLWKLLYKRRVLFHITSALNMNTEIWCINGEGF